MTAWRAGYSISLRRERRRGGHLGGFVPGGVPTADGTLLAPRALMMMHRVLTLVSGLSLFAGCAVDKSDPVKGEVDDSEPSGDPTIVQSSGKSDASTKRLPYQLESVHPYTNNLAKTYAVDLAAVVPACATQVKLHFATLRTEADYDFVSVLDGAGTLVQRFDGTHDDTWTEWVTLSSTKRMSVKLTTDYSVVRDGFSIDQVEWDGAVMCPAPPDLNCTGDTIDLRRPAPACGCREISHCTPLSTVTITHSVGGGFTGQVTGKKAVGTTLSTTSYLPATGETATQVGSIDRAELRDYLDHLVASGVLYGTGRAESANWTECFSITTDQESVSYCAQAGDHTAAVVDAITRFEALGTCGGGGALTCDPGRTCDASGECAEASCVCPALYNPVCGTNGSTYSSSCAASCAQAPVKHAGECGIAGDPCGTIRGLVCQDGFKCRYDDSTWNAPFPDAGGLCVEQTYCDAPTDCAGLVHPGAIGYWTCPANTCTYQIGVQWTAVTGFAFETAHPYANSVSQWKQLYLPTGANRMRLVTAGAFNLEANYDFLEVWTWASGAWTRTKRYTGTVGPSATDEFPGQYFYLKFVSDPSVTREGFKVLAEYR